MDFFEIGGVSIAVAFAAGLLSVLSPCVFPLIPAYLGYLTGASLEGNVAVEGVNAPLAASTGTGTAVLGGSPRVSRPSPFGHSLAFVSGFTTVFVLFGVALGVVGYFFRDNEDLILKAAGIALIVMGLHLANVITIPILDQERRIDAGAGQKVGYARSYVVGAAFSAGWSPCIGPTLGAIYTLSVASGEAAEAGVLLLVYSIGLSIPFLLMGAAYGSIKPLYNFLKRHIGVVNYISGAMLIVIGILIFTDSPHQLEQHLQLPARRLDGSLRMGSRTLTQRLIALAGIVVIVAVALGLLSLAGVLGNQGGGEGIENVTLLETPPAPDRGDLDVGAEVGKLAPDFEISDFDGDRHRSATSAARSST